jgi:hypothetical protein
MTTTNLYTTSAPANLFLTQTGGYVQGLPHDDVVTRQFLTEGTLISSATFPMWGGIPIAENVNNTAALNEALGPVVFAATSQGGVTGFSTFLSMMHMTIDPGANVPLAAPLNGVGFFRLGTNTRLAVACDPALITAIAAGVEINSQSLFWDVTNLRITLAAGGGNFALPTSIKLLSTNTNSKIVSVTAPASQSAPVWALGSAAIILL